MQRRYSKCFNRCAVKSVGAPGLQVTLKMGKNEEGADWLAGAWQAHGCAGEAASSMSRSVSLSQPFRSFSSLR